MKLLIVFVENHLKVYQCEIFHHFGRVFSSTLRKIRLRRSLFCFFASLDMLVHLMKEVWTAYHLNGLNASVESVNKFEMIFCVPPLRLVLVDVGIGW